MKVRYESKNATDMHMIRAIRRLLAKYIITVTSYNTFFKLNLLHVNGKKRIIH